MAIFGNPSLFYLMFAGSIFTVIGLSIILVKVSLRDQAKALLQERLDLVKHIRKLYIVETPRILLKKPEFVLLGPTENRFAEYLRVQLGLEINPKLVMAMLAFLAVTIAGFFASYFFFGTGLGLILGIIVLSTIVGAVWFLKFRRNRFLTTCEAQLSETLDYIVRTLKAGHAFPTSIGLLSEELPPPLGPEFRRIFKEQELGIPLSSSLLQLARRIPIANLKYFVTAYQINREIGGNLAEVLDNISKIIRERFKLKRHVQAITAEGRISAWILGVLPFVVGMAMYVIRTEYVSILLTDPVGQKLMFAALCLWFLGIIVINRMVQIEF